MADRLAGRPIVAAVGADHHRRRRRLPLAAERSLVGEHDMHARRLDRAHHLDRAGQLALQRSQARDVLHERGEAERPELVEEFVADRAAARQALFGEDHAGGRRLPGGNQHHRALGVDVEWHAGFAQRRADRRDVVAVEPGIERLHRGPAEVVAWRAQSRENRDADQRQRDETADAQPLQVRP